jgi:hypothetical protein
LLGIDARTTPPIVTTRDASAGHLRISFRTTTARITVTAAFAAASGLTTATGPI